MVHCRLLVYNDSYKLMIGGEILTDTLSIKYSPKNEYKEVGYHKTLYIYVNSIKKNGFKPSNAEDDWLGFGVYFWDNIENAKWWNVGNNSIIKNCIIECELKCDMDQYVNLNDEMDKLESFCEQYMREIRKNKLPRPNFKNNNQRKKFFCDLYCKKNNLLILSFRFEHDIMNKAGFKIGTKKRRQICVRDPKLIQILSINQ